MGLPVKEYDKLMEIIKVVTGKPQITMCSGSVEALSGGVSKLGPI